MNLPQQTSARLPVSTRPSLFGSLQREIDRLFDDFAPAALSGDGAMVRCKMDVAETKEGLELTFEVPGLDEKDIQIEMTDGMLTVSGEKRFEEERKDKSYRVVERGYGSFSRSVQVPAGVKAEDIKASLAKGVLKVTVPTPAKPQPAKITVSTAS